MIYFDNAATSWPKPPQVAAAMVHFLGEVGANPGRSGHRRAVEASRTAYQAREAVCELLSVHPIPCGCKLIPIPRPLSSDCGVCVRIAREDRQAGLDTLQAAQAEIDACCNV